MYSLLDTAGSAIGLPVYAYATATQTFALQYHSAGDMTSARRYLNSGMQLSFSIVGLLCILCGIFDQTLLHLIIDDEAIIQQAQRLLWLIFLLQLAKIPYQIHMNYLQGIGREKFVLLCTAAGTIGTGIGVIIAGTLFGLTGLCLVMTTAFVSLGICYILQTKDT